MKLRATPIAVLAEVRSGGAAPQDPSAFGQDGHAFVRAGSLVKLLNGAGESSLEKLSPISASAHGLKLFPRDTVLFAKSGMSATKGHVYRLKEPAYVVSHLAALVPRDAADGRFLTHALQRFSPVSLIKDPAYPSIRLGDIEAMTVLAPSNVAQRAKIAAILDQALAVRQIRQHAINRLATLGQAVFFDMFGDPRLRGTDHELPLGSVARLINGRAYRKHEEKDSGTPVLRIQNLNGGSRWFYSDLTLDGDKYCDRGDLLFAWSGTFGPYMWRGPKVIYHYHIWKIEPGPQIQKQYLFWLLKLLSADVKQSGRGISMTHATKHAMDRRLIPVPPLDLQKKFAIQMEGIGTLSGRYKAALDRSDQLFAALQDRAFSGEP